MEIGEHPPSPPQITYLFLIGGEELSNIHKRIVKISNTKAEKMFLTF